LKRWGGDVRLPGWLRRMLRRPAPVADSSDHIHEKRQPQQPPRPTEPTRAYISSKARDHATAGPPLGSRCGPRPSARTAELRRARSKTPGLGVAASPRNASWATTMAPAFGPPWASSRTNVTWLAKDTIGI
jgi:hypothetical protein